jgi:hypothetical protein
MMTSLIQNKFFIFSLLFFLLSSCGLKEKNQKVILLYYGVSTNYFKNDSLQKIAGYYPQKIFFYFKITNATTKLIYVPLRTVFDSTFFSDIKISYGKDTLKSEIICPFVNKGIIKPNETFYYQLQINSKDLRKKFCNKRINLSMFENNCKLTYVFDPKDAKKDEIVSPVLQIVRVPKIEIEFRKESPNTYVD